MGKKPDTWMPFYISDYLRDTSRLTTEGHGAYVLLIFDYWVSGKPLPDDDSQLAAITRLAVPKWRALKPTIASFFQVGDGLWRHKRIDAELAEANAHIAKRSGAGKAGAEARWSKKDDKGNADADGNRIANASEPHCDGNASDNAPITLEPSSSLRSEDIDANASPAKKGLSERELGREFEEIWPTYPRRVDKQDALKAYCKARKIVGRDEIKAGVARYAKAREGEDAQFTKHFARWLNAKCWADDVGAPAVGSRALDRPDGAPPPLSEHELEYLGRLQ